MVLEETKISTGLGLTSVLLPDAWDACLLGTSNPVTLPLELPVLYPHYFARAFRKEHKRSPAAAPSPWHRHVVVSVCYRWDGHSGNRLLLEMMDTVEWFTYSCISLCLVTNAPPGRTTEGPHLLALQFSCLIASQT